MFGFVVLCVFGGVIAVCFFAWIEEEKRTKLRIELSSSYQNALAAMELDPESVELRTAAVRAGRAYSEACREHGKVTIFDEVAMSNDLVARQGKSTNPMMAAPVGPSRPGAPASPEAKTCPDCAEEVKAAARKCRFCGYEFEAVPAASAW